MKKRLLSILVAMVMAVTTFGYINTVQADAATASTYWIKVNTKTNVVTVYKKTGDSWKPYRAMICSTGGSKTPTGSFTLQARYQWRPMVGGTYAQYATRIVGHYLFHSVPYNQMGKKNSLPTWKYEMLGTSCSLGCIRLTVMDAKWIYENCPNGTKVTIHRGKYEDPLGKPDRPEITGKTSWDPTDPDPKNPVFNMKKPEITVDKPSQVSYGKHFKLKKGVKARNLNAYQDLSSAVNISKIRKFKDGKYVKAKFSTKSIGTYKITYKCYDKYCGGTGYKTYKVRVVDKSKPTISAKDRTVTVGEADAKNALRGVTAEQKSCKLTSRVKVSIKAPGKDSYVKYTRDSAKKYVFKTPGDYKVKYEVANKYYKSIKKIKYITVTCEAAPETGEPEAVE